MIFSDLLCDREPLFKGLEMLRHRRHDVMVFHVMDDDELLFPFAGMTKFEGLEELPDLLCDPRALRDGYLEALEEYLVEVRRGCTRIGVEYNLIRTSDYLDAILSRFLYQRMSSRASPVRRYPLVCLRELWKPFSPIRSRWPPAARWSAPPSSFT